MAADPNAYALAHMEQLLEGRGEVQLVGTATSAARLFALIQETRPAVLVADSRLDGLPVAMVLDAIRLLDPSIRVVVLASEPSSQVFLDAIDAGADSYVSRASVATGEELAELIAAQARGIPTIERTWLPRLLAAYRDRGKAQQPPWTQPEPAPLATPPIGQRHLPARALTVLGFLAQGKRNREIAQALGVSEHTVKQHVNSILRMLNVTDRIAAVAAARAAGLLDRPSA